MSETQTIVKTTKKLPRLTIYDIKYRVEQEGSSPYFFDRKTMKFFGQTLKMFSVTADNEKGKYLLRAARYTENGRRYMGVTQKYFNPETNKLEFVYDENGKAVI